MPTLKAKILDECYMRVLRVNLSEAAAEIMGGSEVHVEAGSTLNLTCVVRNSRERPHYLLWYHSNEVTIQGLL